MIIPVEGKLVTLHRRDGKRCPSRHVRKGKAHFTPNEFVHLVAENKKLLAEIFSIETRSYVVEPEGS